MHADAIKDFVSRVVPTRRSGSENSIGESHV
jgi:hypothetical protein